IWNTPRDPDQCSLIGPLPRGPMSIGLRRATTIFLLTALSAFSAAQSLTGRVVDPAGNGIAGVNIFFSNGGPSATTNATGNFTAAGLQNRTYNTVDFQPLTSQWAPHELLGVHGNGTTNIGNVILQ